MTVTQRDIEVADHNWRAWQDVFEHVGSPQQNPLLTDAGKFADFLWEYGVGRTIRKGRHDELRRLLGSPDFPLTMLLDDASGNLLDREEAALRSRFGTLFGRRSICSALSKIAALLAPQSFSAWDKYARKGANLAAGRRRSHAFSCYAEYLAEINRLLEGTVGNLVRRACSNHYPTAYAAERDRFHRRVLDVYLMRVGGTPEFRA